MIFSLIALLLQITSISVFEYQSFEGIWRIHDNQKLFNFNGTIPGSVYSNLVDARIIKNPLFGFNDIAYRNFSVLNWTFTHEFKSDVCDCDIALVANSIDSVAKIYINNYFIGDTSNMFRKYIFNLDLLLQNHNLIDISFTSPLHYVQYMANTTYKEAQIPPDCPLAIQNGECHVNLIRKQQCSFSWDWGPAIPDMGILGDIAIIYYKGVFMNSVNIHTFLDGDAMWRLTFVIEFHVSPRFVALISNNPSTRKLNVIININFRNFTKSANQYHNQKPEAFDESNPHIIPGLHTPLNYTCPLGYDVGGANDFSPTCLVRLKVPRKLVKLWWPNGHGAQPLYKIDVSLFPSAQLNNIYGLQHSCKDSIQIISNNIGFRTLELNQDLIDFKNPALGRYFYFVINGRKIYAKGSNWIPASLIQTQISPSYLEHLLRSTSDANMNMLRVWGGGSYESDLFYDLADRYGILIWQDAMFACSLYPGDSVFLSNVAEEIRYQATRLQSHPSIVIWSSNNENEFGIAMYWFKFKRPAQAYISEYKQLAYNITYGTLNHIYNSHIDRLSNKILSSFNKSDNSVEKFLAGEMPEQPYSSPESAYFSTFSDFPLVISSPSNGILETFDIETCINKNPQNPLYGDMHYYNYLADLWDWRTYPRSRFVSEYGFQSLPSLQTLQAASAHPKIDLTFGSKFMGHRQHHTGGYIQMLAQIARHFRLPTVFGPNNTVRLKPGLSTSPEFFEHFIYLSQIVQARIYQVQTEFYRRNRDINTNGTGFNMGALYWQLNDVWAAPTWSSIEYGGRWKMSHYYAKSFFAPILLSIHSDKDIFITHECFKFPMKDNNTNKQNCIDKEYIRKTYNLNTKIIYTLVCDLESLVGNEAIAHKASFQNSIYALKIELRSIYAFEPTTSAIIPINDKIKQGANIVFKQALGKLYPDINKENENHYYIFAQFIVNSAIMAEQRFFLDKPINWAMLKNPDIKITNIKVAADQRSFTLNVQAKIAPAYFVWFEFMDNISTCAKLISRIDKSLIILSEPELNKQLESILNTFGTFTENGFTLDTPNPMKISYNLLPGYQILINRTVPSKCFRIKTLFETHEYLRAELENKGTLISNDVRKTKNGV